MVLTRWIILSSGFLDGDFEDVGEDSLDGGGGVFDSRLEGGLDDLIGKSSTLSANELQGVQTTPQIARG